MDRFDDIPETALSWHQTGQGAVLATVIETWGSAPRPVGSQMAINGAGQIIGSVSGGCVEGAVVIEAQEALQDNRHRILEFGVSDGDAFAVGLACGGKIKVLVEPIGTVMPEPALQALTKARTDRVPVAYVVDLDTGHREVTTTGHGDRFRMDRSGFEPGGQVFVAIHNPPLRMVIVGAVHIAQALVPMARIAGFDPFVVDPRESFASAARFPQTELIHDWPDAALEQVGLDARTALVLLTHDPKLDDPALHHALRGPVFYIGALGSKRTHAGRCERLSAAGFTQDEIARIHGPVGLDLGAASPSEIAVSIMAQIIGVLRGRA